MFGLGLHATAQAMVLGTVLALAASIAGLSAVRYRGSRDPSALFLAAGSAVLAFNTLLIIAWTGTHPALRGQILGKGTGFVGGSRDPRVVLAWWFVGWIGAGAGMLLLRPWWDRRGRAPIRPAVVAAIAAGSGLVLDGVCLAASAAAPVTVFLLGRLPPSPSGTLAPISIVGSTPTPGLLGWLLGIAAAGILVAAAVRLYRKSLSRLLAAIGATAAALGVGSQLQRVTVASLAFRWVDAIWIAALGFVFAALLANQRAEETRMRRASDRARLVMGGRAEIATMLGHEVKGPVATIRGLAGTSIAHYDRLTDDERREFLVLIEQESRRLLVTVDQASLAMKVDAGTLTYDKQPVDLALVLRDAVDTTDLGGHPLTMDTPDPGITATADRRWLTEALRQVLVNAAAFSPPDALIRLALRRTDAGTAAIEVVDAGPGIPEDQRERVFEKFAPYRPPGYEEATGTGLGLFLTRGIVAAHGGSVVVAGAPTGGTMLTMTLPVEN